MKKFIPCRKCAKCRKPIRMPKANKSGLCHTCSSRESHRINYQQNKLK